MSSSLLLSLSAARGVHMAALVGLFGMLAYRLAFLPALVRADSRGSKVLARSLDVWTWRFLVLVFASAFLWLPLQAAQTAGAVDESAVWAATPVLALHTGFGFAWCLRLVLVTGVALAIWRRKGVPAGAVNTVGADAINTPATSLPSGYDGRPLLALLLCSIALLLQAEMGHAAAVDQAWIRVAHGVHVLAAAIWLGALLPLVLTVQQLAPGVAVLALRRFSGTGSVAVAALAGSALTLAWEWSGGWVGLVSTVYGRLLLTKLVLLMGLLALAALHRWRLVPALAGASPALARNRLLTSLGTEVVLGLATLALAAGLATQPPGVHDLAVWPFAWRPDPAVLADEGYVRRLSQTALMALTAGVLLIIAFLSRRLRGWAIAGSLCLVAAAPLPAPGMLLIPAYPSSFQHAPTGFDSDSIVLGQQRFAQHCASCHGDDASGRGPRAANLPMWPPNLAGHMLWDRTDGEVFWRIGHGLRNPSGTQTMPGFADSLPEEDIWALVNFLFANAGGTSAKANGGWAQPLRAPVLQAQCQDGQVLPLDSLRGRVLHIVADDDSPSARAHGDDGLATTITLLRDAKPRASTGSSACVVNDASAWQAYALVAGLSPDSFAGTQLLIDRAGWLRARRVNGDPRGWTLQDAPLGNASSKKADAPADEQTDKPSGLQSGIPSSQASMPPAHTARTALAQLIRRIDLNPVDDRRAGHAH